MSCQALSSIISKKAIMIRSKLKRLANKSGRPDDMARFRKQRNFVVNLNRKTKKTFFAGTSNSPKCFWKAIKPYFGERGASKERILLVENDAIISDEKVLACTFNKFFNSITDSLMIPAIPGSTAAINDPVSAAILKYKNHPSMLSILYLKRASETFI